MVRPKNFSSGPLTFEDADGRLRCQSERLLAIALTYFHHLSSELRMKPSVIGRLDLNTAQNASNRAPESQMSGPTELVSIYVCDVACGAVGSDSLTPSEVDEARSNHKRSQRRDAAFSGS